jgi:alkylation response protein AidB-like acyl-CoA dehydrogenase
VHPYPKEDPDDAARGGAFLVALRRFCESECDGMVIERESRIPDEVVKGLAQLGAFGIKIPREDGGLGLSQVYYNRALEIIGSVHPSWAPISATSQGRSRSSCSARLSRRRPSSPAARGGRSARSC